MAIKFRIFSKGAALVANTLLISNLAFAWGHTGHEKLAEVATTLTTYGHDFWQANMKTMGVLANVPDVVWKAKATYQLEKGTHFFQPDSYFSDPSQFSQFPRDYATAAAKYTSTALDETGTATWRAQQLYTLAVAAFKSGDFQSGIEYAGTMSHYIGDLSQPLHVTKNYDGQETNDKGIHGYFETENIQTVDEATLVAAITQQASAMLSDKNFVQQSAGKVIDTVFNEVSRAYSFKDAVINNDLKLGRSGAGSAAQLKLAESRMGDGAATLAIVLSRMWNEAGNPQPQAVTLNATPTWVRPDYSQLQSLIAGPNQRELAVEDDCNL
jgi:hypothetical protein